MKKVGVIAEYNPFHNRYLYHLEKVKEMFPNCSYILILIGNFTQKNDNKWNKTKIDLEYGYDLVVELPYLSSTQPTNYYDKSFIDILNHLNCNYLVSGSETNDIDLFNSLADILTYNNKHEETLEKIKEYFDNYRGLSEEFVYKSNKTKKYHY